MIAGRVGGTVAVVGFLRLVVETTTTNIANKNIPRTLPDIAMLKVDAYTLHLSYVQVHIYIRSYSFFARYFLGLLTFFRRYFMLIFFLNFHFLSFDSFFIV